MACFAAAGMLSASLALLATYLLRRRPFGARMAATLFLLLLGTAGLSTLFMTLKVVLTFHRLNEIPVEIAILVLGIAGLGALYNVLTIAAPLILPLGLPATAVFAFLIARRPR